MEKFSVKDVTRMWNLLYEEGYYLQVRCISSDPFEPVASKLCKTVDEYIEWIKTYNGKGELYIGSNPRNSNGKVGCIKTIFFDFDAKHSDGKRPSLELLDKCKKATDEMLRRYPDGALAFTGNGFHVIYSFPELITKDFFKFSMAWRKFNREILGAVTAGTEDEPFNNTMMKPFSLEVRLDDLHDPERLDRIVGTISCRGEKRITRFLVLPSGRKPITRLQDEFRGIYESISVSKETGLPNGQPVINSDASTQLPSRTKIGHPNRQKYLVSLAGSLHRRGLSEQFIFEAVKKAYQENCVLEPLKTDAKLLEIVKSIMKYPNEEGLKHYGSIIKDAGIDEAISINSKATELEQYNQYLDAKGTFKAAELTTGFKGLDDLCNGYQRGDIFTLGAYTGGGKSTLLVNSADALCKAGKRVLFLSTEMAKFAIFNKFFSLNTGTNYVVYDKGNFTTEELDKRNEFAKVFKDYNLIVDDDLKLSEQSTRLLVERNKPDVLIFDHIHEVGNGSNNYYGFLKDFTHGLQLIARDYNCAVVLAAQFQRPPRLLDATTGQYKKPPKPTTQSIKACGDIENKSRVVALLSDTFSSLYPEQNTMELEVAKCSKGSKGTIRLGWEWKVSKFKEI